MKDFFCQMIYTSINRDFMRGGYTVKILVCDDDKEIARAIEIYLNNEGFEVVKAYDGFEAINVVKSEDVKLAIMDVMMPRLDGIQATQMIRNEKDIPIIMLSAKAEDYDKIIGLNIGADDYVTKPFNPMELVARVKSQLRRYTQFGNANEPSEEGIYRVGGLTVDDNSKKVTVDGRNVTLTATEFGILRLLAQSPDRVFSMEQIYESVWDEPAYNPENTVAVHIRHIREKIEINPKDPRYIKVVWGTGYKLEGDN